MVIAVAAVVIVVALVKGPRSYQPSATMSPSPSATATATPKVGATKTPVSTAPGSYADAVNAYANRRIQFDQYCQAVPKTMTINKGTAVMFDNRSGDARTFGIGGLYFTLPGYGWKILVPPVSSVPTTLYIDCGSARNVGTILVQ